MAPSRRLLLAAVFLLGAGTLFQGARLITRQRAELQTSAQRSTELEKQLAALRRAQIATAAELALAEAQLARLPDSTSAATLADPAERARAAEIAGWLVAVKRLKQLLTDNPGRQIPELRLLTTADWLRTAKAVDFEDTEALLQAFAALREVAKSKFFPQLLQAVSNYASSSNNNTPPPSVQALAAFLPKPANADFLARYELTTLPPRLGSSAASGTAGPTWAVRERSAIDADYDGRITISPTGSMIESAPFAWIPDYFARAKTASDAFAASNPAAAPPSTSQLLPYFNPPLAPAIAEKLLKAERIRQGRK